MNKHEFLEKICESVNSFESHWSKMMEEDPEGYPFEMSEDDWWDQIFAWIESELCK